MPIDDDDDDDDYFDEEVEQTGPVKLKMSELLFAYQDDSPDNSYYLDTGNGTIKYVNRNLIDLRDLTDEIERERWRFKYIPKPEKQQLPSDLKKFHATVLDEKLSDTLTLAFESPHVLSSFKKILEKNPEELNRLERYLADLNKQRIREWLKANFIEHEFVAE